MGSDMMYLPWSDVGRPCLPSPLSARPTSLLGVGVSLGVPVTNLVTPITNNSWLRHGP